jgi:ribose 5-phosphate isomerase B
MKIVLAADHGGFVMKEKMRWWLADHNYVVEDVGAMAMDDNDDYVDFAVGMAEVIGEDKGILFCRNGMGMVIAANRFKNIRCGFGFDVEAVRRGRMDDDINCLAIPADYLDEKLVMEMIDVFMDTDFSHEEKYVRRLEKLEKI